MKCKKQVQIKDGKEVISKNKMRMIKGVCPKCGTKVCKILGKADGKTKKAGPLMNMSPTKGVDYDVEEKKDGESEDEDW